MSDDLDRKIRDVVAAVAMASPPPPPMPERGTPPLVALVDPPPPARRRRALVVLAAAAAVVVTATSVLVSSSDRDEVTTASPAGSGIAHQRIAYQQDASGFDCVDDTEVITGEFDSLTADVWTSPDGRTHTITEYPDGRILSTIVEDTGIDAPVFTRGADLGRAYRCASADNVTLFAPSAPALWPPHPMPYSSGAVVDDDAVDSTGRPAVLWRERIDGAHGDTPLTQISEWYLDPDTGHVLEQTWSDTSPRYGTVTWRATLVTDEPTTPPGDLFDTSDHVSLAHLESAVAPPATDPPIPTTTICVDEATCGLVEQIRSNYARNRHPVPDAAGNIAGWITNEAVDRTEPAATAEDLDPVYDADDQVIGYYDLDLGILDRELIESGTFDLPAARARHAAENPRPTVEEVTRELRDQGYTEDEIAEIIEAYQS